MVVEVLAIVLAMMDSPLSSETGPNRTGSSANHAYPFYRYVRGSAVWVGQDFESERNGGSMQEQGAVSSGMATTAAAALPQVSVSRNEKPAAIDINPNGWIHRPTCIALKL